MRGSSCIVYMGYTVRLSESVARKHSKLGRLSRDVPSLVVVVRPGGGMTRRAGIPARASSDRTCFWVLFRAEVRGAVNAGRLRTGVVGA